VIIATISPVGNPEPSAGTEMENGVVDAVEKGSSMM